MICPCCKKQKLEPITDWLEPITDWLEPITDWLVGSLIEYQCPDCGPVAVCKGCGCLSGFEPHFKFCKGDSNGTDSKQ